MKLGTRILVGLLAVSATAPLASVIILSTDHDVERFEIMNSDTIPAVVGLSAAKSALLHMVNLATNLALNPAASPDEHWAAIKVAEEELNQSRAGYEAATIEHEDLPLHSRIDTGSATLIEAVQSLHENENASGLFAAAPSHLVAIEAAAQSLRGAIDEGLEKELDELRQDRASAIDGAKQGRVIGLTVTCASLGLAAVVGLSMGRGVSHDIRALVEVARRYGAGDFRASASIGGADEFVVLASSMQAMATELSASRTAAEASVVRSEAARVELQRTNEELRSATEVQKALQDQLLSASRLAGMAEVATGVLHNVGNVLNSVNVAACVMGKMLSTSDVPNLARAGVMLGEHRSELAQYLTTDAKGRFIPDYLIEATKSLGNRHQAMIQELEAVTKGVDHIKHIVNNQQKYAKGGSVGEMIVPSELFEAALRMQIDSLQRYGIEIERHFDLMPPIAMDKHLVLQILVNLIGNAKQALLADATLDKRLTLEAGPEVKDDAPYVFFRVRDSGIGIRPENLTRIFGHGFTTKKDGHGFGLHSAANAAKVMGGSLTATSEGPGLGATFSLSLPAPTALPPPPARGTHLPAQPVLETT